jgi:acyl dehydratase
LQNLGIAGLARQKQWHAALDEPIERLIESRQTAHIKGDVASVETTAAVLEAPRPIVARPNTSGGRSPLPGSYPRPVGRPTPKQVVALQNHRDRNGGSPVTCVSASGSDYFYEDTRIGAELTTPSHELTAQQIAAFTLLTGERNPMHLDLASARAAGYDDIIAPASLVQSIALGLIADMHPSGTTTIALLGTTMRFVAPTFPGDAIHVVARVVRKRSRKDGVSGLVYRDVTVSNQHGRMVIEGRLVTLMRRRPLSQAADSRLHLAPKVEARQT